MQSLQAEVELFGIDTITVNPGGVARDSRVRRESFGQGA
jgi:hypothetical protein